jgi:tetratricopeptide (TPR) repeat protein
MKNDETLDNAISLFEMNTVNFPSSSKAFSSLGDAYAKKGQKQKAISCYQKAIELNPAATVIKEKLKRL